MVANVMSFTGNGLRDWILQRVSAVVVGAYTLFLVAYLITHPQLSYSSWHALFACRCMKVANTMAMLGIFIHAWIGIWTVLTDYIKCACFRITAQVLVNVFLISLLIWAIAIFWGVSA